MAAQRTETILDTTRRLEWVVTKEMFESCDMGGWIDSGEYNVQIGGKTSKWKLHLRRAQTGPPTDRNTILIVLGFLGEDVKVEVQDIGIKSEADYCSCKPTKLDFTKNREVQFCHTQADTEENFLKKFSNNKITVMAVIQFYVNPNETEYTKSIENTKNIEREQNFLSSLRSISDLDTLADFSIICEGREFKCHRVILASMSTVFRAMILNLQFVENKENSVTIEDSTPDIVEAMLEFMAKGVVPRDIEEKAIDLIALADKYDLQDLIKICENSLADNITVENVIETLIAIDLHVPNSEHRQKIVDFIKAEGEQVVKSRDWNKFVEKYPNLVTEIFLSALREPRSTAGN